MMYFLVLMLFFQIIFFYIIFDRNILSPTLISTGMFFFSSLIALLYAKKWQVEISLQTTVIIFTSLFMMGMGELLVRLMTYKGNQFIQSYKVEVSPIRVKKTAILFLIVVFCILLLNYYKETVRVAMEAGYKKNQGMLMLYYAKIARVNSDGKFSSRNSLCGLSYLMIKSIAYIFSYVFLYNKILCKEKKQGIYLLPVALFIPYIILGTMRTELIYLTALWIMLGSIFFMQTKNWNPKYTKKVIAIGVLGILVFLMAFVLIGALKSTKIIDAAFETIAYYTGLSIPSLDYYFANTPYPENRIFGEHTLIGIYNIFKPYVHSIPDLNSPYEFVSFNNVSGNVYTAIRRYHQDFGYFGLYAMMFFIGFFYAALFLKYNKSQCKFGLLLYTSMLSPIVEISIEERFLLNLFTISNLKTIIFLYIFWHIFVEHGRIYKRELLYLCKSKYSSKINRTCILIKDKQ